MFCDEAHTDAIRDDGGEVLLDVWGDVVYMDEESSVSPIQGLRGELWKVNEWVKAKRIGVKGKFELRAR